MNRILVTVLGLLLVAVMVSPQSAKAIMTESTGQPNGVYCGINDVKLFAQSAEDCEKAGGSVTHTVTTTVQPAENPNAEPEIQRDKNKKPEAP